MAEAILKRLMQKRADASKWQIASAGTWAQPGAPPALLSQLVVFGMGGDISAHESQLVTPELIRNYDLILTMERQQKEGLILRFPTHSNRIFMLSEMVGRVEDIPDPIIGELADYQASAQIMERFLTDGLTKIQRLARRHAIKKGSSIM